MILDPGVIAKRDKLILAGLFLSRFDTAGLSALGFESFTEAFNVIGLALGGKPAAVKNYRDEFDPVFPNRRAGWHHRSTRSNCAAILERYKDLDFETFSKLIMSFVGCEEFASGETAAEPNETESAFARRLSTGLAAECYFESIQPMLTEFSAYALENTTRLGCGFDFLLRSEEDEAFIAIEVKGLTDKLGSLSLTPKEHDVAEKMADRFYLFVVKNFRESPYHEIYRNPLAGSLSFERKERVLIQVAWLTTV